jgi:L-2-hydroxyglutarate oxidase
MLHGVSERSGKLVAQTSAGDFEADFLVNCAGLQSDRVHRMCGGDDLLRIVPFRGEYFYLREAACELVKTLIYPVPDPALPFLGVHLTRTIDDHVKCGPNAVLALGREAYERFQMDPGDMASNLEFPGFHRLIKRHFSTGVSEMMRSLSKRRFLASLQELVPALELEDLEERFSGIRAQPVTINGDLVDDFVVKTTYRAAHVLSAPSPAATACLSIAMDVANIVDKNLDSGKLEARP